MRLPLYQVDAFTDRVFAGNPAAVVPLPDWLPAATMQAIAAENNLSETAFFVAEGDGVWGLRWFTPSVEVDLCGHATLATAHVISTILAPGTTDLRFRTQRAGELRVTAAGDLLTLDFPARPPHRAEAPEALLRGLGGPAPQAVLAARDYLVVYETAEQVAGLAPDMAVVAGLDRMAIVTAPGPAASGTGDADSVDFVSRFFAPGRGIPEDPVTGSAHCTLIPYWAERLGRTTLEARQLSRRGGRLRCALAGDRVRIGGRAVLYLDGHIHV